MRKLALVFIAVVATVAIAGASFALARGDRDRGKFRASLDGWQEVSSQVTTGEGSLRIRKVNDTTLEYVLRYEDLEGDAFAAHIHIGSFHENGPVSVFLCGGGGQDPCPPREGTVEGQITGAHIQASSTANGVAPGEFADLLRAIRKGETYANVHTSRAGGGEIRGQIRGRGHKHDRK